MKKTIFTGLLTLTLAALFNGPALVAVSSPALNIEYNGARISADLTNAPLGRVLETLHEKIGIDYQLTSDVEDLPISAAFKNLELETGLKKILVRVNNALIYGPGRQIKKVVIFNKLDTVFPDLPLTASSGPLPAVTRPLPSLSKQGDQPELAGVPAPLPPPDGHGLPTGPSPVASPVAANGPDSLPDQNVTQEGPTRIDPPSDESPNGPAATAESVDKNDPQNRPVPLVKPTAPDMPSPQ